MVDEMIEQAGQHAIMAVMQGMGRIALKLAGKGASQLAHALSETGKWPVRKTRDTIRESINSGNMSEKRLQNLSGGDLHQIQIDDESIREVTKSLKQAGVNYSIEQGPDGTWLHFAGRDNDHIMHAVQRAFNKLGIDFDPEESLEKTTPPNKTEQAKETPESIQATAKASASLPESVSENAPQFTMRFRTVDFDPQAEIISNNLDKLNIPYTMTPGEGSQSFTFAQPYAPAVKEFIDAYAQHVVNFDTTRVANYEQLDKAAHGQPAAEPDTQAIPRQTNQTQAPAAGNPASEQQAQPMPVREDTRPKQAAQAPADRDSPATKRIPVKKTTLKAEFRAQVEQRTKQKLAAQGKPKAPVQKPSRTR